MDGKLELLQGHSVTRKLNSDGKVDTMQTLHNLNEGLFLLPVTLTQLHDFPCVSSNRADCYMLDELAGFEKSWKGNSKAPLPGWTSGEGPQQNAGLFFVSL